MHTQEHMPLSSRASDATLFKARWSSQLSQIGSGLSHLQKGVQRFVSRRPLVTAGVIALGVFFVARPLLRR